MGQKADFVHADRLKPYKSPSKHAIRTQDNKDNTDDTADFSDMEFEVFMQHMRMDGISKNNKKHVTELKETDYKLEDKLESVKDTINKIGTTVLVAQRKMIDFKN